MRRYRLSVLGPVTLRTIGVPNHSSAVTQPRQLAVLCYLALAQPHGLHPRETLIELLWPDESSARGRRALRNALHGLRKRIGADAILTVGENLIGINPDVLECDALELEEACYERRHPPEAIVTATPFDGFHVASASPFADWVYRESQRLRSLIDSVLNPDLVRQAPPAAARQPSRASGAEVMCARGQFLFLRAAHGGAVEDLSMSKRCFDRALALDPNYAPALAGLSNYYAVAARRGVLAPFQDVFAHAVELARQALAADATLAVPHVHLGVQALYLDDDWERAGAEFRQATELEPDYAEGRRFYGVWLGLVNRHGEALSEMEVAADLEPDIPHMASSLGAARLAVGDRRGAEESIRHALSLDPRHVAARQRLVRLLEDEARLQEALLERNRAPALPSSDVIQAGFDADGEEGYMRALRDTLRAEAEALEIRLMSPAAPTVEDIFYPPYVRLVALYARLGDWKRVRSTRMMAVAARPSLARWFESLRELHETPGSRR